MKTIFTAIALDDSKAALNDLEYVLNKYVPEVRLVAKCTHPRKVEAYLKKHGHADLFFCDIRMGVIDGLKVAKKLSDHFSMLLFFSDYPEYRDPAEEIDPDAFLEKPVDYEIIRKKVRKLKKILKHGGVIHDVGPRLFLKSETGDQTVQLSVYTIASVSTAEKNHVRVVTTDGKRYKECKSVKMMMIQLNAGPLFVQAGKSTYVALAAIDRVDNKTIYLNNGYFFPIARRYYPELMQRLRGNNHEA